MHSEATTTTTTPNSNAFVGEWLNGKHPDLIKSDTPESFRGRTTGFIDTLKREEKGVRIITTHFELVTLCHSLYVEGKDLGEINEDFDPPKGGGVIIWKDKGGWHAKDYGPDFLIV